MLLAAAKSIRVPRRKILYEKIIVPDCNTLACRKGNKRERRIPFNKNEQKRHKILLKFLCLVKFEIKLSHYKYQDL